MPVSRRITHLSQLVTLAVDDVLPIVDVSEADVNDQTKKVTIATLDARYVGGGAPTNATYITQTPDGTLTNEQALSALATGILRSTTGTGVVTIATEGTHYYAPGGTDVAVADGGTGASNAANARTNLGLVIGTDVQAWDAQLDDIAALAVTDSNFIVGDGANWVAESGATARTSLGLGTIATQNANTVAITGGSITGITDLAIADGGTGQSTQQAAIDALTNVAGATNEHVLTKDTGTGNAIFKAAAGGALPVADTTIITQGSADATKQMRFENDTLISAGTTRVMTIPDTDQIMAGRNVNNSFSVGQLIDGTADEVQLTVQADAAQTANVAEFETSAGTVVAGVDSIGRLFSYGNAAVTSNFFAGGAGNSTLTSTDCVGIGSNALAALTTGSGNFGLGQNALSSNQTGTGNTAIGNNSLRNCTGGANVGLGASAGIQITSGSDNVLIGGGVGSSLVTAQRNVGIGSNALDDATSSNNVAIGYRALLNLTSGGNNTVIGYDSMVLVTTGVNNTALGYEAGRSATGSSGVFLGYQAGRSETNSNRLYISNSNTTTPLVYGEFDNGLLKFFEENADTNVIHDVLYLVHNSSGTPAANFGTGLVLQGESSTTASQDMAQIAAEWQDATHATRKASLVFNVYDTAARECLRLEASGSAAEIGFFGTTPTTRQTGYTTFSNLNTDRTCDADATNVAELADILGTLIEDLKTLGLISA